MSKRQPIDKKKWTEWYSITRSEMVYRFWFIIAYLSETRMWWYVTQIRQKVWPRESLSNEERLIKFLVKQGLPQEYIDEAVINLRLNLL